MNTVVLECEQMVGQLARLQEKIMAGENDHCFVEREEILARIAEDIAPVPAAYRYAYTLEQLLAQLSTPIEAEDVFLGRMIEIAFDALFGADNPDGHLLFPALYSLHHHIRWGRDLPATPEGRRAGEPISENQSPSYGADRAGLSALLLSAALLPHHRTVMGGLNVKFGSKLTEAQFTAMLDTYFGQGGLHLGFTCVDKETLLDAQAHPERYPSLCVRITGFSEYFCALSPQAQQELIDRTVY